MQSLSLAQDFSRGSVYHGVCCCGQLSRLQGFQGHLCVVRVCVCACVCVCVYVCVYEKYFGLTRSKMYHLPSKKQVLCSNIHNNYGYMHVSNCKYLVIS